MVRKLMTAALILTLGLSVAGCGNKDAGTAANRWAGTGTNAASQEWAIQRETQARGPLEDSSTYHADRDGRVDGYHARTSDGTRGKVGEDLKDAGKDLGDAAKDAARGVGDAAEDTLDAAKDATKKVTDSTKNAVDNAKK